MCLSSFSTRLLVPHFHPHTKLLCHKNIPSFLTYKYNDLYANNKPNASNKYVISYLVKDFCEAGSPLQLFHKLNNDNDFQSSRYLYNGFVITITKTLN